MTREGTPEQQWSPVLITVSMGLQSLVALGIALYFYIGFYGSDDIAYVDGIRLVLGEPVPHLMYGGERLAITLHGALVHLLSGGSLTVVFLSFALYHPLLSLMANLVGRLAYGWEVALPAGWIVAFCPLIYRWAGCLLPDNSQAFWNAVSAAAVLVVVRNRHRLVDAALTRCGLMFAGGLAFGIAYWAKESTIVLAVPMGLGILLAHNKGHWRAFFTSSASFAAGALVALGLELVLFRIIMGKWWMRLLEVESKAGWQMVDAIERQGLMPWTRFHTFSELMGSQLGQLWWPVVIAALAFPFVTWRRKESGAAWFVYALFGWYVVYQTVGTISLTHYFPPIMQIRYYAGAVVPAAVVVAAVFVWGLQKLDRLQWARRWYSTPRAVAVLCAIIVIAGSRQAYALGYHAGYVYYSGLAQAFHRAYEDSHARYPNDRIVLDEGIEHRLLPLVPADIAARHKALPSGSFLFVHRWPQHGAPSRTLEGLMQKAEAGEVDIVPVGDHAYPPWKSRWDELQYELGFADEPVLAHEKSERAEHTLMVERVVPSTE